jgi:predicted LPLAT superfamily acyltransferase
MKKWNSQSIGKPWQHYFFYVVIRFLGRYVACFFMYFVVLWYVLFYPPIHAKCKPYLSKRFPHVKNGFTRLFYEYRWVTSLGRSLIDRAAYGIRSPKSIEIEAPDGQKLLELLDEGKGLIVISAHTGCWQIAFSALKYMKTKVHLVIHQDQSDIDKHYYEFKEEAPPFNIIDPEGYLGGTLQMVAVLQKGETLGLMGDRVFGNDSNTMRLDFLGAPIKIPVASFRLAAMQGTPIAVLLSYRESRSRYRVELSGIIRVPVLVERNPDAYIPYGRQYLRCLTSFVQDHPFDFYNYYDMWESNLSNADV